MRRVSVNKTVLSSRLNSVRQMPCCSSSAGRRFHSRGPSSSSSSRSQLGRRVAPPWPRRMACLQRLAGTDPVI